MGKMFLRTPMTTLLITVAFIGSCLLFSPTNSEASEATTEACRTCHSVKVDKNHDLGCTSCHAGNSEATNREQAHMDLIAAPAHPDTMDRFCGKCHRELMHNLPRANHFTLKNEVNTVRGAFGMNDNLADLKSIPEDSAPSTVPGLIDDMLRRKCLRCHLYSRGDAYPGTRHGAGCAGCHLPNTDGSQSHQFIKTPPDDRCLACHHGNFVGADYYGLFEHDYHWEYQTPFVTMGDSPAESYGIEYHQLIPDLHAQAGMNCVDCHSGAELKGMSQRPLTCATCHNATTAELPDNVKYDGSAFILTTKLSGKTLLIPQTAHPAHKEAAGRYACGVCHAQWSFYDKGTHLIRYDDPVLDDWVQLSRQGDYELEAMFQSAEEGPIVMHDKINGRAKPGIWIKAFEIRRWAEMQFCRDAGNVLHVCRPILDLHLSYVDEAGVVIDNASANGPFLLPYVPHTMGKAGAFYPLRLKTMGKNADSLREDPQKTDPAHQ